MAELIRREEVKKAFEDRFIELQKIKNTPENKSQKYIQLGINWCINKLAEIETVEERKVGKWIEVLGGCKCPFCDMAFSRLKETCSDNFCPNCGAEMRGSKE